MTMLYLYYDKFYILGVNLNLYVLTECKWMNEWMNEIWSRRCCVGSINVVLVICFYIICSVVVVSFAVEFCVKCQHYACFVLLHVIEVHTVHVSRVLWGQLIGVKENLDASLTLTAHGGECWSIILVLGNLFHLWQNYERMDLNILISSEIKRVYK
jgi:hypothetical protein